MYSDHINSARILVIDDEEVHREVLRMYLGGAGYGNILFADDSEQGWKMLQGEQTPDLVLLDRMLPGMDGIGLLKRIKENESLQHIPVIMQTAAAGDEIIQLAHLAESQGSVNVAEAVIEAGFMDFIMPWIDVSGGIGGVRGRESGRLADDAVIAQPGQPPGQPIILRGDGAPLAGGDGFDRME